MTDFQPILNEKSLGNSGPGQNGLFSLGRRVNAPQSLIKALLAPETDMKCSTFLCALWATFLMVSDANAASFSCTAKLSHIEQAICDNKSISNMDTKMSYYYKTLLQHYKPAEAERLKQDQRAWLIERNQCSQESDLNECIHRTYLSRLLELSSLHSLAAPENSKLPNCKTARTRLNAIFFCASPVIDSRRKFIENIYPFLLQQFSDSVWLKEHDNLYQYARENCKQALESGSDTVALRCVMNLQDVYLGEFRQTLLDTGRAKPPVKLEDVSETIPSEEVELTLVSYLSRQVCYSEAKIKSAFVTDVFHPGKTLLLDYECLSSQNTAQIIGFFIKEDGSYQVSIPPMEYFVSCYRWCENDEEMGENLRFYIRDIDGDSIPEIIGTEDIKKGIHSVFGFSQRSGYYLGWVGIDKLFNSDIPQWQSEYQFDYSTKSVSADQIFPLAAFTAHSDNNAVEYLTHVIDPKTYVRGDNTKTLTRVVELNITRVIKYFATGHGVFMNLLLRPAKFELNLGSNVLIYHYQKNELSSIHIDKHYTDLHAQSLSGNEQLLNFASNSKLTEKATESRWNIYQIQLVSGKIIHIADTKGVQIYGSIVSSFDGRIFSFAQAPDWNSGKNLYYFSAGMNVPELIETNADHPSITDNGTLITYKKSGRDIYIYDTSTKEKRLISGLNDRPASCWTCGKSTISPNGDYLLYRGEVNGKEEYILYSLKLDTWHQIEVPGMNNPLFSGDSQYLLFSHSSDGRALKKYSLATGKLTTLLRFPVYTFSIERTGRYITFVSNDRTLTAGDRNETSDIYIYDVDRKKLKRVSIYTRESIPSDTWIEWASSAAHYVLNANRVLSTQIGQYNHYRWEADKNALIFYSSNKSLKDIKLYAEEAGIFNAETREWRWNPGLQKSEVVDRLAKALNNELDYLTRTTIPATEALAWEITSVIAESSAAQGVYRVPKGKSYHYLIVRKMSVNNSAQ